MKRKLTMIIPALLCGVAIVAAQAPAQQPPSPTEKPAVQAPTEKPAGQAQPSGNKVTLTGCVAPGAAAGTWTLNNAQMGSGAGAKAEPGAAGTAGAKQTYNLIAKPGGADLKTHASQQVEVTGTLSPAAGAAGGAAGEKPAAGPVAKQNLNIESIKMVSATCS